MNYRLKKVWLVVFKTSSNEDINVFDTRSAAYHLFEHTLKLIKQEYPDEDTMESNLYGSQHNAYYGLLNKPIELYLIGQSIQTRLSIETLTQYKKELIEEKNYAI